VRVGFLFGVAVILDQVAKLIVRQTMEMGQSIPILGHVLKVTYVENPGIAFGIRVGNGSLFTVLSVLASFVVFIYFVTHRNEGILLKGSLALILGGAFGNLIDRIVYRQVVDFIDVGIGNLRWPVFNVADSAVVVGMSMLFYSVFIAGRSKGEAEQEGVKEVE